MTVLPNSPTNTQPRDISVHHQRGRERERGFPVELGESNKRVVQNYSTPSRRIYTSTVTAGGKRHSLEQCSPKCPCSSPASSIFFLRERDTAEDNKCIRIPNFSYTEFHPLDIPHHSLGNLGSRGERKSSLHLRIHSIFFLVGDISSYFKFGNLNIIDLYLMDNAILFSSLLSSILASVKKYIYIINQYNRFPKNYFRFNFTDSHIAN